MVLPQEEFRTGQTGNPSGSEPTAVMDAADLLVHYSFELGEIGLAQLLAQWVQQYQARWVRLAVIEALYQGRYKAVSVEQILALWQRRQHPVYHFNHEFERLVCHGFPRNLVDSNEAVNSEPPAREVGDRATQAFTPERELVHENSRFAAALPAGLRSSTRPLPPWSPRLARDRQSKASLTAAPSPTKSPVADPDTAPPPPEPELGTIADPDPKALPSDPLPSASDATAPAASPGPQSQDSEIPPATL